MTVATMRCLMLGWMFACTSAPAHEFWVMPARFDAQPAEGIGVQLRVGAGWPGESVPRKPERIVRFAWIDALGEQPLIGERAADPAGRATARVPGFAVLVYRSNAASISLRGDRFQTYLREEGLDEIAALRTAAGTASSAARERYSRCAKALVRVGSDEASRAGFDRVIGLPLELVPLTDPSRLRRGQPFVIQLLHDGRPLEGALLNAFRRGGSKTPITARTDARGRATIPRTRSGVWLISTVHMVAAEADSGADWSSIWSSLTLRIRP